MWISFMIVGSIAAIAGWLIPKRIRHPIRLPLSAVLIMIIAATGFFLFAGPTTLGPKHWWQISPWPETCLYIIMIFGTAARWITKSIEDRRVRLVQWRKAGSIGRQPKIEFDKWELLYPLLISIITFGVLLSQIKNHELTIENVIISFQTGFFWQTLIDTLRGS